MAQTKKKRKRKHRGTPAGTVQRTARTAGPGKREDTKKAAAQRRSARLDKEPTWRGSVNRAAIAALVFGAILLVLPGLKQEPRQVALLVPLMFVLYIPLGYMTDRAIYNFRKRRRG